MKTLILFTTKSGASRECAELLRKKIPNCIICDLSEETTDIRNFDTIIIGAGVRMGKVYKPALKFIKQNMDLLLTKKIAVYLCNAYSSKFEKIVIKNIPREIIESAIIIKSFGGKKPFSNSVCSDWLDTENMMEFINIVWSRNN